MNTISAGRTGSEQRPGPPAESRFNVRSSRSRRELRRDREPLYCSHCALPNRYHVLNLGEVTFTPNYADDSPKKKDGAGADEDSSAQSKTEELGSTPGHPYGHWWTPDDFKNLARTPESVTIHMHAPAFSASKDFLDPPYAIDKDPRRPVCDMLIFQPVALFVTWWLFIFAMIATFDEVWKPMYFVVFSAIHVHKQVDGLTIDPANPEQQVVLGVSTGTRILLITLCILRGMFLWVLFCEGFEFLTLSPSIVEGLTCYLSLMVVLVFERLAYGFGLSSQQQAAVKNLKCFAAPSKLSPRTRVRF